MNRIKPKNKTENIDQNENIIRYFKLLDTNASIEPYDFNVNKIINAKKKILVASTGSILNNIIEASYQAISNNISIYIILKSFDNNEKLLAQYGKTKPAIIREIPELENNFIIIDNQEFLFLQDLKNEDNTVIPFETRTGNDLFYWFNYYFWNKATKEKILDKINTPKESPYPSFCSERKNINIENKNTEFINAIFPHDSKFKSDCENYENIFISRKIDIPFYFNNDYSMLGNLVFNKNLSNYIMQKYELQTSTLQKINTSIIPFDKNDWTKEIQVVEEKIIDLQEIRAENIEAMESTKPEFISNYYSKNIKYEWRVLPPIKNLHAKKARLYSEYENLKQKLDKDLEDIERELNKIIESKSPFLRFFSGSIRKATTGLEKVKKWKEIDLKTLSYNDLIDKLSLNGEFSDFYKQTFKDAKQFRKDLDYKQKEAEWKNKKENKEKELKQKQTELENIENKKTDLDSNISKKINTMKAEIDSIQKEIEKNYTKFTYLQNDNELESLRNPEKISQKIKPFNIPKYQIPEIGNLFEDNNNYYLEIENYEDLEKANEIANKRYIDKPCKVVAKGYLNE